jgi:hypothetical protein
LDAFKEKLVDLNLAPNKRHSLIDFISTLSVMAAKACTVKNIQHGFIEAGMIDINNLRYSVFKISTCQRNPSVEEYKNIESNMTTILHESLEYGHISEEVYNRIGIARDRDSMGREVLRNATISQESYQHTKCLTHEHQIYLQKERLAQNQRIEIERKQLANQKHLNKISWDSEIVRRLCRDLEAYGLLSEEEHGTVNEEFLTRCALQMFANLNCHDLDAFIMARQDRDNPEFTAKNKIPKKGSTSEALLGVRNKILIAFECRQIKKFNR